MAHTAAMSDGSAITIPKPQQGYHPATFLERGAVVPFTTPQLMGARARPGERVALELIVPNPSGARGLYILPWARMPELCRPTVHDRKLAEAVAALRAVTPLAIRHAARAIAAEGLAGRAAAEAATGTDAAEEEARLLANFGLLLELVRQVESPGDNPKPPEQESTADLEQRAKRAIGIIAPALGRANDQVAAALEELAGLFSGIGVGAHASAARIPATQIAVATLRKEIEALVHQPRAAEMADFVEADARGLMAVADITLTCARKVTADARALTTAMPELLRRWLTAPDDVIRIVSRPDWLMDGWERICLIWRTAGTEEEKSAALAEMAELVPALPHEVGDWVNRKLDVEAEQQRHRRKVVLMEDWRTGSAVLDMIERNEQLVAMAG